MASWEKNGSGFWPTWQENKLFTVLLSILIVYSIVWVGTQMKKTMRETAHIGISNIASPTIAVSAVGKASIVPDIATTDFSVTKTAPTETEAQSAASVAMSTVLAAIKSIGILEKDIQTSSFNTSPVYDYDVSPAKITGYQSTQSITVKIRDTALVSSVLDAGPKNGATTTSGIRYEVDDTTIAIDAARAEAIAKAKVQAFAIAKAMSGKLGRVVSYTENEGGNNVPMYYGMADSLKSVSTTPPTVSVGEQEISMTVYITYVLN